MPLADWITEHLLELHGVGAGGHITWIPFAAMALICATLLAIRLPKFLVFAGTLLTGGVMLMSSASHGAQYVFFADLGLSQHVVFLWLAGLILTVVFSSAASDDGEVPNKFRSAVEVLVEFVNDQIVFPVMGDGGRKYLPTLLSFFFFIFACNLLGLLPGSSTATGSIYCTGALAGLAGLYYHLMGIQEQGLFPYIVSIVPVHADMKRVVAFLGLSVGIGAAAVLTGKMAILIAIPVALVACGGFTVGATGEIVLWLFMLLVEAVGHGARLFALMVRLFANMTGGHAVLYVMFGFIFVFKTYLAVPISIGASTAVMFLEMLVAGIQAYVFTILLTVFLQGAIHPDH